MTTSLNISFPFSQDVAAPPPSLRHHGNSSYHPKVASTTTMCSWEVNHTHLINIPAHLVSQWECPLELKTTPSQKSVNSSIQPSVSKGSSIFGTYTRNAKGVIVPTTHISDNNSYT